MVVCEQLLLVGVEPLGGLAVDGGVVDYGNRGVLQQIAAEMLDPALLILGLFIMGLVAGVNDQPECRSGGGACTPTAVSASSWR